LPEVDVLALEGKDCNGDSVLAADEEYEADKVLSIGMVAAKNEDKLELDRAIQAAKEVMVIAEETIEVPLKEKSTESGLLVCTSNQEVKDTPIEDTSTKDEEGEDVRKKVEEFFVEGNETLAALLVHISIAEQLELLSTVGENMVEGGQVNWN